MPNLPVPTYNPNLPAFLQRPDLFAEADKTIAGIGGGQPPSISIRGSRFHLVDAAGDELHIQNLALDVIVLGGNEHLSKTYYPGAYDANAPAQPPTCWSDNGVAPSAQAATPQSPTCAACQYNAWGSKVTPQGSQVKACTDSKKLAVVLAADTPYQSQSGAAGVAKALEQVYLLRVPAASMRGWADYAKEMRGRGAPVIGLVTRIAFDPEAAYPLIVFQAISFVTEPVFKTCQIHAASAAIAEAVGSLDQPRALPAGLGAGAVALPLAPAQPAPVVAQTVAPAPIVPPAPEPTARPRGRPRAAATAPAPVMVPAAVPAPSLFPLNNGSGTVIEKPTPTDAGFDAMLAAALAK